MSDTVWVSIWLYQFILSVVAVLIEYLGEKIISSTSNITVKVRHDNISVKDWYQQ